MTKDRKTEVLKMAGSIGASHYGKAIEELRKQLGTEVHAYEAYNAILCMALNFISNALQHMNTIAPERSLLDLTEVVYSALKFGWTETSQNKH